MERRQELEEGEVLRKRRKGLEQSIMTIAFDTFSALYSLKKKILGRQDELVFFIV